IPEGTPVRTVTPSMALNSPSRGDDWQGVGATQQYDPAHAAYEEARRFNNDDYYQVEQDGRIYVFPDVGSYHAWLHSGEIPLVATKIGGGPGAETLKFALTRADAKGMEKFAGYRGAAQRMYEGDLPGVDVGFYAELVTDTKYYVFSKW